MTIFEIHNQYSGCIDEDVYGVKLGDSKIILINLKYNDEKESMLHMGRDCKAKLLNWMDIIHDVLNYHLLCRINK